MTITDERLKRRAQVAISLQSQGEFLIDQRQELPLSGNGLLSQLRYSRAHDEHGRFYHYETEWGKFNLAAEDSGLLVLRQGTPPAELWPQAQLDIATGTVHTGYVSIHNNGSSFELDLQTRDLVDYAMLRLINQTLAEERIPLVVWELQEATGERLPIIRIANESAMVFASSAIWSQEDQQLVAAQVVTTSQDLLKAIKATLANGNHKSFLTVKTPKDSAYLKGARRGFINASSSLVPANAEGTVTALLHPASGDPQANGSDFFYLVVTPNEGLLEKFAERLDLAIPWPLQSEWAEYLLEAGKQARLVEELPKSGDDFAAGLRVIKNESRWQQLIAEGLQSGHIHIK